MGYIYHRLGQTSKNLHYRGKQPTSHCGPKTLSDLLGIGLKKRRRAAGIAGRLLCVRADVDRGRLSDIERGYADPSDEELARIEQALATLIEARDRVARVAAEVGWPF